MKKNKALFWSKEHKSKPIKLEVASCLQRYWNFLFVRSKLAKIVYKIKWKFVFLMSCSLKSAFNFQMSKIILIFLKITFIWGNYFWRTFFGHINLWNASFSKIMTIHQISLKFVYFGRKSIKIWPPKKKLHTKLTLV